MAGEISAYVPAYPAPTELGLTGSEPNLDVDSEGGETVVVPVFSLSVSDRVRVGVTAGYSVLSIGYFLSGNQVPAAIGIEAEATGAVCVLNMTSRWMAGDVMVGQSGTGYLAVEDGGKVTTSNLTLAQNAGSHGSVYVAGRLSSLDVENWQTGKGPLTVAQNGTGYLAVEAAGAVNAYDMVLAQNAGSHGSVYVAGKDSRLTLGGGLSVGAGTGVVEVATGGELRVNGTTTLGSSGALVMAGGSLSTTFLSADRAQLSGTGSISTTGFVGFGFANIPMVFDGSRSTTILLSEGGDAITLALTPGGDWPLIADDISVRNGASVSTGEGYVGYRPGASARATITGTGSSWSATEFTAGYQGTAAVRVEAGAKLDTDGGYVGREAGSEGQVAVTGEGSRWSGGAERIFVGDNGRGSLTVTAGAYVSSGGLTIGHGGVGDGEVRLTGEAARWVLHPSVMNPDEEDVIVGDEGVGRLIIEAGAYLSNCSQAVVGHQVGSEGSIRVAGTGSHWNAFSVVTIGAGGEGSLVIADEGEMQVSRLIVGDLAGSHGEVTVQSRAELMLQGDPYSYKGLIVGNQGEGELRISGQGLVWPYNAVIGSQAGASGRVWVEGADSRLRVRDTVRVGDQAQGIVEVSGGADFIAGALEMGWGETGEGTMTVRGASSWLSLTTCQVGGLGSATLAIVEGARAYLSSVEISYYQQGNGRMLVSGAGTVVDITGMLKVATVGNGTLTLADRARMSVGTSVWVGFDDNPGTLNLLVSGDGMLTVKNNNGSTFLNWGTVNAYAGATLAAGTYAPISSPAYGGTGGAYRGYGGTWDASTHTFTAAPVLPAPNGFNEVAEPAGTRWSYFDGQMVVSLQDEPVGSWGLYGAPAQNALIAGETTLGAYDLGMPGTVLLSVRVGAGFSRDQLLFRHRVDTGAPWQAFAPEFFVYDGTWVSFPAPANGGYAVTVAGEETPLGNYFAWQAGADWSGADPDPATRSGDGGLTNLQAYAFGAPPRAATARYAPIIGTASEGSRTFLALTYRQRRQASDLAYTVEASDDLVTWVPYTPAPQDRIVTPVDEEIASVEVRYPIGPDDAARFLRVRVSNE